MGAAYGRYPYPASHDLGLTIVGRDIYWRASRLRALLLVQYPTRAVVGLACRHDLLRSRDCNGPHLKRARDAIVYAARTQATLDRSGGQAISSDMALARKALQDGRALAQAAAKHLNEGGSVINIGSSITSIPPPTRAVYDGSKAAVESVTIVLSK